MRRRNYYYLFIQPNKYLGIDDNNDLILTSDLKFAVKFSKYDLNSLHTNNFFQRFFHIDPKDLFIQNKDDSVNKFLDVINNHTLTIEV